MASSSSPDGVREDDFVIPAVPSNDDFASDPNVRWTGREGLQQERGDRQGILFSDDWTASVAGKTTTSPTPAPSESSRARRSLSPPRIALPFSRMLLGDSHRSSRVEIKTIGSKDTRCERCFRSKNDRPTRPGRCHVDNERASESDRPKIALPFPLSRFLLFLFPSPSLSLSLSLPLSHSTHTPSDSL